MENQVTNNNDEIEIDLGEIFHLILSRLGLIILSGIILGVISIIGTMLFITPQYESTTKIMVLNKQDSNTLTSADMQTSTQLTKDYAELIKSRTVLEGVIAQLNLNITYQQLLGKLTVDTSTDSRIVTIIVSDEDPYTASEMANAIRDMAAEHIQSVMDIEAVNVVDSANIPSEKASPSLAKNGVIGGLLWVVIYHRGKLEGMTTKGILIMIVLSLYFGFTSIGVDNWCHVGGMLCGFLATLILYHGKRQKY